MGSDVRHVRGEAQKELVKKFEVFTSKGRSRWQVWSDWITISAIAVSNATDKSHFDEREQQYMTIVKKYTKQEVDTFADMFSILVMALEDNSEQDFLGELYMCLGLGSDHAGQFFTPYHLCEFMSAVTTPAEEFQQKIGDRGWVAVCDPTCGAGALLVAFANECRKKGINYQTDPKNYKAAGCDQRNIDHTRKWGADHSEQAEPSGSSAKRAERDPGKCCIKRVLWPLLWLVFHGMQYGLHELHRLLHGELYWVLRGIVRQ